MSLVHSPQPLLPRTNTPRVPKVHFKLPVLKKSAPTVSVTNANAARSNTSGILLASVAEVTSPSSVPFPSTPIPCPPPRKRAVSEHNYDAEEDVACLAENSGVTRRSVSHTEILRRRAKSCLAASFFHHNSHLGRKPPPPSEKPTVPEKTGKAAKSVKRPVARRESMSAGTPTGKTNRKARRFQADAHFLASMHSSIASHVRMRMNSGGPSDDCAEQDLLLAERIWQTLFDMGYKPVPLEAACAAAAPSPSNSQSSPPPAKDPAREAAERAARRTMAASSTPISLDRAHEDPLAPPGILTVPQLVAVLILRHHDRATTRPRSTGKNCVDETLGRSPLSASFVPPTEPYTVPSSG
ncbi:hypothetical protein C8Q78DRAFT_210163 [Trametes maxima]|nr:hypothetical protein C8Q78DRAFT_210163 [Trametes maxima]